MSKAIRQIAFYASLLGLWQVISALKLWPTYLFPTPATVYESLQAGFADQGLWIAIAVSLKRVVIGYAISCALGIVLGFVTARSRLASETLGRLFVSLQSLPSICWLPVAILWFGLSEKAILFVVIMGSVLSITISVETGLRSTPNLYLMAGRNLGARGWGLGLHVLLPACMPHLVSGLKQGWAFAWRSLISGEMIFVTLGLGQVLMLGRELNDISQVFAVMLLIVAIGWLVDALCFRPLEWSLQKRWGFPSM
jgi:NitT/TauT family transport system permease protein